MPVQATVRRVVPIYETTTDQQFSPLVLFDHLVARESVTDRKGRGPACRTAIGVAATDQEMIDADLFRRILFVAHRALTAIGVERACGVSSTRSAADDMGYSRDRGPAEAGPAFRPVGGRFGRSSSGGTVRRRTVAGSSAGRLAMILLTFSQRTDRGLSCQSRRRIIFPTRSEVIWLFGVGDAAWRYLRGPSTL